MSSSAIERDTVVASAGCVDRYGYTDHDPTALAGVAIRSDDLGGVEVRYSRSTARSAAARPVVFLHGLGGSKANWLLNVSSLTAAGLDVLALDLPGFAGSAPPSNDVSLQGVIEVVRELIQAVVKVPPVLVGHSFGAFLAASIAEQGPDDVAGMLLISYPVQSIVDPARQSLRQRTLLAMMRLGEQMAKVGLSPSHVLHVPVINKVLLSALVRAPCDLDLRLTAAALAHLAEGPTSLVLAAGSGIDLAGPLHRVAGPVVLVHGGADQLSPLRQAERVARAADRRFVVLPDCGHWLMLERPTCVNRMVRTMAQGCFDMDL